MKNLEFPTFHFAFIYSLVVMLALSLPAYLYIQESLENIKNSEVKDLREYAFETSLQIYRFQTSHANTFIFPKSLVFKSDLLDSSNQVIYSQIPNPITYPMHTQVQVKNHTIYLQISLKPNRLSAKTLITAKEINYAPIFKKALFLFIFILTFLLLSSSALIYYSVRPFSEANRYLDRFFRDAMHEIRTPLGIMQLNLDILEETRQCPAPIKRTQAALKTLSSIYEDIEYFIKYKKVDFQTEMIDFSYTLQSRIYFFKIMAEVKEIAIAYEIEPNIIIEMNRMELQRIIDNTISNAIKYSKEKSKISVNLKKAQNHTLLTVEDEGIGITDTSKIFTRYYRGEAIKGGFGLGLSIVKNICDKYHIDLEVSSRPGLGSTFSYKFPLCYQE